MSLSRRASRARSLAVLLLALAAATSCARREKPAEPGADVTGPPRDLLLVTLDTFRADRAGCYGNPDGLTPSIDRALRSALLARDAFAPAPLTAPSHATMLTALQPYHHGVRENGMFVLPDSVTTLAEHLAARGFRTAAFIAAFPLVKRFGFAQGFETFSEELGPDPGMGTYYAERPASEVVDRALGWIAKLAPGDRAFVWTHFFDAHQPHHPPVVLQRLPVESDYEREIRAMDVQIGRLFRGIEAAGRRPLVVVVSDHGEGLGDHRELSHGVLLHEDTMHGLLGFAAPRGSDPAARLRGFRETVARYTDLAPTVLDALGVAPLPDVDGFSLLASRTADGSYGETYYSMLHYRWSPLLSWRDERWAYLEGPEPELYDRVADPGERHDVLREHRDVAESLSRRIAEVARPPEASEAGEVDAEAQEKLAALGYVGRRQTGYDPKKNPKDFLDGLNSLFRGISLFADGEARAALGPLQAAYRADPGNPVAVFYLANCWRELGDRGTAASYYRRAVDIDRHAAEAWAHLALIRFENGDRAEAFKLLDEGLAANPEAFSLLMTAGELKRDVGRLDEARRHLRLAAEVAPNRFEPWEELAKLEERAGDVAEARKLRERARALAPEEKKGP
jgi:arylsulfatase A-like enzyme